MELEKVQNRFCLEDRGEEGKGGEGGGGGRREK
jgi:hypothetical protein